MAAPMPCEENTSSSPLCISGSTDHPKYEEIVGHGLGDEICAELTLRVYTDLSENKCWWNLTLVPCPSLQRVLVLGHETQFEPKVAVVPLKESEMLSHFELQETITEITTSFDVAGVILCYVGEGLTLVYIHVQYGLSPPDPPEMLEFKKMKREKRYQQRQKKFIKVSDIPSLNKDSSQETEVS